MAARPLDLVLIQKKCHKIAAYEEVMRLTFSNFQSILILYICKEPLTAKKCEGIILVTVVCQVCKMRAA